ncbi:hypothetical protein CPB83DRAFT_854244 [Crepidotus variabilis]|uniref:Uncharacterized protein n=1 Tax=Crepidotus variabilis TaxID=179855 RepID=A0A9P6EGC1_9AGAR|nr:hypothetical protein CPB83DRAFT_854244 [Crepidotus variabilis]
MSSSSPDRDLPPLPQDPPTGPPSIRHSVSETTGTSISNTESGSRRSSRRSSKESSIVYDEITRTFKRLQSQVLDEKKRADEAERRLLEVTAHLKAVNDARLQAMQESARAQEELKLYKIQLDTAQREIYRAQDVIAIVDRQRHTAEKEAAKNRTKARQLNETLLVQAAREEAWRMGLKEGLDRGRNIALAEQLPSGLPHPPPRDEDYSFEESGSSPEDEQQPGPFGNRSPSLRSRAPSEPPMGELRSPSPEPIPMNLPPIMSTPTPSAPLSMPPSSRPPSVHPSEQIRPVSVRNITPTPQMYNPNQIPDNFIPTLDADNRIRIPAPFEFSRTPEPTSSPPLPLTESMEALPIPPPVQQQQQQQSSGHRKGYHRRNSSSGSSSLSALDIVNEPFGVNLRSPMSIIPEVTSQTTGDSLQHRSMEADRSMRHQPSLNGSFQSPAAPLNHTPSLGQFVVETPNHRRPASRQSFAGSQAGSYRPPMVQQPSHESSIPDIDVQPPSRPLSHKTESAHGSRAGGTPASHRHSNLPSGSFSIDGMPPPSLTGMPGGMTDIYAPSPVHPHPVPPEQPADTRRGKSRRRSRYDDDDDAVSSVMSGDTLTTPPGRRRSLDPEGPGAPQEVVSRGRNGSVVGGNSVKGGGSAYAGSARGGSAYGGGGSVHGGEAIGGGGGSIYSGSVKGGGSAYGGGGSVKGGGSAYGGAGSVKGAGSVYGGAGSVKGGGSVYGGASAIGGSAWGGGGDGGENDFEFGGGGASGFGRQPSVVSRLGSSIGYPEPLTAATDVTDMAGVGSGNGPTKKKKGKRK